MTTSVIQYVYEDNTDSRNWLVKQLNWIVSIFELVNLYKDVVISNSWFVFIRRDFADFICSRKSRFLQYTIGKEERIGTILKKIIRDSM